MNRPLVIFLISFFPLWFAAWSGARFSQRRQKMSDDERSDFNTVLAATLTLLGLIIGFSFSMATGRYDLRKSYEEAEANAIGTEYVRADVLPAAAAATVRNLLKQYTALRIRFYEASLRDDLQPINDATADLQNRLWRAASQPALSRENPVVVTLAVSGMNDVINSQGYSQAAWWNRIPTAAWILMFAIALFCNAMLGYGARTMDPRLFMILPLVVAIAFFLIADIDSPRGGVIRVRPQNLHSLQASLK